MTADWPRRLMALLRECRALGLNQVYRWAALRHGVSPPETQAVLLRLKTRGALTMDGEYVMLPYRRPSKELMAAFDVLLQLAGQRAENITTGRWPVLLRFSAGEGDAIQLFSIACAEPGSEAHINDLLQQDSGSNHRWIVLMGSPDQHPLLTGPPSCYFALPGQAASDGRMQFRFFTPNQEGEN